MGLKVSDQEFRDELQYGPYKQAFFPGGKWIGADKYKELLTQGGTTVENFERDVRLDLLQRKLVNVIGASATATECRSGAGLQRPEHESEISVRHPQTG